MFEMCINYINLKILQNKSNIAYNSQHINPHQCQISCCNRLGCCNEFASIIFYNFRIADENALNPRLSTKIP